MNTPTSNQHAVPALHHMRQRQQVQWQLDQLQQQLLLHADNALMHAALQLECDDLQRQLDCM